MECLDSMSLTSTDTNTSYLSPAPSAFRLTTTIKKTLKAEDLARKNQPKHPRRELVCANHMLLDLGQATLLYNGESNLLPSELFFFFWKVQKWL